MDAKDQEISRLKRMLEAYEKLSQFSHRELLDAHGTIIAQEKTLDLSRDEIVQLHDAISELEEREMTLREQIRKILSEDEHNESRIIDELEKVRESSGMDFYVDLFKVLVHHNFLHDDAVKHYEGVRRHMLDVSKTLGRPIGFRVAMLDYFVNLNRVLKNPMIIEINIFDEVLMNTMLDALTGLYNRRYFDGAARREFNRATRHGHAVCLLVLDMDDFKHYNDTHGHAAGDAVLSGTGRLLREHFRAEDSACRYGGEEFVVILPETETAKALITARRFLDKLKAIPFEHGPVTVSGGIAHYPAHGSDMSAVFLQADAALYRAKLSGKGTILAAQGVA